MLAVKRQEKIVKIVERKGMVTVDELVKLIGASSATIRRDLIELDQKGMVNKVFGGATKKQKNLLVRDIEVAEREKKNGVQKNRIAHYASNLIGESDYVFIDAGTTTGKMIPYLHEKNAIYVTNDVAHASRIAAEGLEIHLVCGKLKSETQAVVGSEAIDYLSRYHFSVGFFGTNGITEETGCTTPDIEEAAIKRVVIERTKRAYVLADRSKFFAESTVTFANVSDVTIITDQEPESSLKKSPNILVV